MLKLIITPFLILFLIIQSRAAIEFRDTIPINLCDTVISKTGVVSLVKIISISHSFITYTQCSDGAKKQYSIGTSQVRELKSKTFALSAPIPLLSKAKTVFIFSIISAILFFFTFGQPGIFLIVSPILLLICLFSGGSLLGKAKKEGNKRAMRLVNVGLIIMLLAVFMKLIRVG